MRARVRGVLLLLLPLLRRAGSWTVQPSCAALGFGVVEGFDLRDAISDPAAAARLRADVAAHRLLVFRGQAALSAADHVALSERLGSLDHGLHSPHPAAPDPRLLRVSNDDAHGFRSIGGFRVASRARRFPENPNLSP